MTVTFPKTNGSVLFAEEINCLPPIGSVTGWLKSLTGCPTLPSNWVECNGQTLSDADSPFNGQVIPNLNADGGGTKRFLRGSTTSGTTGGSETHTHTLHTGGTCISGAGSAVPDYAESTSTLPSYYEVVWVMKIK
jgi:hypothetical protein